MINYTLKNEKYGVIILTIKSGFDIRLLVKLTKRMSVKTQDADLCEGIISENMKKSNIWI